MSALTIGSALALALACSPQASPNKPAVSPDVLVSVAYTESGLDPIRYPRQCDGRDAAPEEPGNTPLLSPATRLPLDTGPTSASEVAGLV